MSDKWICWRCKELNNHGSYRCNQCGRLKFLHGEDVVKVQRDSNVAYIRPPTIMRRIVVLSRNSSQAISRCPSCEGIIFANDKACIHCSYFLTDQELKEQPINNLFSLSFYGKSASIWGLIFFTIYVLSS